MDRRVEGRERGRPGLGERRELVCFARGAGRGAVRGSDGRVPGLARGSDAVAERRALLVHVPLREDRRARRGDDGVAGLFRDA